MKDAAEKFLQFRDETFLSDRASRRFMLPECSNRLLAHIFRQMR
ncbi:MAG: hypothetical protein NTV79_11580 [Candidatus Aureabacteria bacterium]|nr:hypothetical protein [Candidatus Auribacterota bacterium]